MPAPYSLELRERVIRAVDESPHEIAEIAGRFRITQRTIYTWLARRKEGQTLAPKPHAERRALRVDEEGAKLLARLVDEKNDRTLAEYADAYFEQSGVRLNRVTLHRAMLRLKLPWKKKRSAPASGRALT